MENVRAAILDALADIAPEAEPGAIDGDVALQEQLDLDSMDFLNLLAAVAERTGVEVPERVYDRVATLDGFVGYVSEALAHDAAER
jgi:acyl carrier protein